MKRMILAFIVLLSWSVSVVAGAEYNESNVMLYFNPTGGTRYHADMNCPSASEKYLPLAGSFSWDQLYDHPYIDLLPCSVCNAPQREGGQISKNGPDIWVKVATVGNEEDGKVIKEAAVMRPDGSILQRLTYLANNDTGFRFIRSVFRMSMVMDTQTCYCLPHKEQAMFSMRCACGILKQARSMIRFRGVPLILKTLYFLKKYHSLR